MFSSLGLFKNTPCPEQPHCSFKYCLFAHDRSQEQGDHAAGLSRPAEAHLLEIDDNVNESDGPRKRRRIDAEATNNDISQFTLVTASKTLKSPIADQPEPDTSAVQTKIPEDALPRTASRKISPPPRRLAKDTSTKRTVAENAPTTQVRAVQYGKGSIQSPAPARKASAPKAKASEESLNPRMLLNPPVSHPIRTKLLTLLWVEMARLNEEVKKTKDRPEVSLALSDQELIVEALDEESQMAKKNPTVYQNVIKSRIMVLRKMKLSVWTEERTKKKAQRQPAPEKQKLNVPEAIDTGLTPAEEIAFVPRLAAVQEGLSKHGYITTKPTAAELEVAMKGVESAQGWELCDRCKTRFQVFPGRRGEDGALTSGGNCTYHWARARRPESVKGDTKPRDLKYACCDETVGVSAGCTKSDTHVFKISDPKRLALVMPFQLTPTSDRTGLPGAVCFDCEMGYTTLGLELIRLTATAFPDGRPLLDVLVRPLGEILDLNSRFSGVWPEDWEKATPLDEDAVQSDTDTAPILQIVESPVAARELLFRLLTPETPLIGHALENDLNAVRILHPVIVDTCLLYAHPRGLPIRYGLKVLMKKHFDRDIQMGGDQGHDSKEDARAAGDLVRRRIGKMWEQMKLEGWSVRDGEFYPPLPPGAPIDHKLSLSKGAG
ncbi:MAG: hypothetical protein LQ346_005921 [Caloplaca aetnensis]|nr:MAG: hypothetical protein LQ346_005921 [Caloplaca aetnensis]